ncbi:hypothetical protein [Micromonospora sp. WMMD1155]|uniref:ArsR/SmtB family transcription factor n=1 Tax=Micromonospora sp. WMMD1155 TaxID=3016094 RepID=UPI0032B3947A
MSQHLKVLKCAGLVVDQAVGTRRVYRLSPVGLAALRDQLDTFWRRALDGYQDVVEETGESIGPTWQIETDLDLTSEVEVTFVAETPDQTRVQLEHRHIDRHGPGWESVRDGVDTDSGWPLYLDRYQSLIDGAAGDA